MGAPAVLDTRPQRPLAAGRALAHPHAATALALAPVVGALALWGASLGHVDAGAVSGYGLLTGLPPAYYAALALLTVGFGVYASLERPRTAVMATYVGALVAILHATTAIVYPEPRYMWTYKHIGVIDYLASHGSPDRSIDIYNNWPGFFGLNAWFSKVAGVDPMSYAAWAQPAFELAFVAAVVFALRGLTRDSRLVWTGAWLFVVANWIGQDYLAPQAFAFLLSLVIVALVLRCAPWAKPPRFAPAWTAVSLTNRLAVRMLGNRVLQPHESAPQPLPARAALIAGGLMYVAVVVSHQLSPLILISSVAVLIATTRRPPAWVLVAMVVVEVWWVSLGYGFISEHFKLLEFDFAASARSGLGAGLPGVALGANLARAGIIGMALLALCGLVRRIRGGHLDASAAGLVVAPLLVVLFQNYGGEGPLRVYMFALPFLAFFVAAWARPSARARTAVGRSWRLIAVTAAIGTATLFGYFGQEPVNYVTHDDVAVSRWYLDHTPPNAGIVQVAPSFPDRLDANYVNHLGEPRSLLGAPGAPQGVFVSAHMPVCNPTCGLLVGERLRGFMHADGARSHYLLITPSALRYARYYGLTDPVALGRFTRAVLASPDFQLVYRHGDGYVFRYLGDAR
jgi:hypothetical protein